MIAFLDIVPDDYDLLVAPLPDDVTFVAKLSSPVHLIHFFTKSAAELTTKFARYRLAITPDGVILVSWPKKASKVPTNITGDSIRHA